MKVLFMGSPEIAATILDAIINSEHEVVEIGRASCRERV